MTDTLLERIKAAMGTYGVGYVRREGEREFWDVFSLEADCEAAPKFDNVVLAEEYAVDLNARAVIDAIVGMVRWEAHDWYSVATFVGVDIGETNDERAGWHTAIFNDANVGEGCQSEARAAVEAAFRAALMGGGK